MTNFNMARVHRALTANAEKRLLIWIAERLPGWINSDHLTFTAGGHMHSIAATV